MFSPSPGSSLTLGALVWAVGPPWDVELALEGLETGFVVVVAGEVVNATSDVSDRLDTCCVAVMGPWGGPADLINGREELAACSSLAPGVERIFSRSVYALFTVTAPSFLASSMERGSGRWHNILKLEAFHFSTAYFSASAYFSTRSISGPCPSIPFIAAGRIKSSSSFVEMEGEGEGLVQYWSQRSPRVKP